jgi:hypothetical protein
MNQLQTGCAMAQDVSWQPLTTEAKIQSQVSTYEKCGVQNGTGTHFSPSTSVFPCHFNFNIAPYSTESITLPYGVLCIYVTQPLLLVF